MSSSSSSVNYAAGGQVDLKKEISEISLSLPTFERRIISKILTSTNKFLDGTVPVRDVAHLKELLSTEISRHAYQECSSMFASVFREFTSDRSKEMAKNNVRRLANLDQDEEVKKLNSKVYGEIELYSFCNLLERVDIKQGEILYDLGHGTGKAMVAAALLFGDKLQYIKGIELLKDLFDISLTAIKSYKDLIESSEYSDLFDSRKSCSLIAVEGDFLTEFSVADWTNADIVFANSTCFNAQLMQDLAVHAVRMRPGSRFITFTSQLPSDCFVIREKINLGMSWGAATCYIHVRL